MVTRYNSFAKLLVCIHRNIQTQKSSINNLLEMNLFIHEIDQWINSDHKISTCQII